MNRHLRALAHLVLGLLIGGCLALLADWASILVEMAHTR